jgi:hypothetical protein
LQFPPRHCSFDRPLGDYYQDLRAALQVVEAGYHGTLDARGVPLVRVGKTEYYFPVTVAQYALAHASAVLQGDLERRGRLRNLCDWLVENQATGVRQAGLWLIPFDNPKYPWLRAPWASALAQGQAISALLRGAELLNDRGYAHAALRGYEALHGSYGPPLACERGPDLWYEEYPAEDPLHVLNGHVYALLGVLDVARACEDPTARTRWERGVETLARHLPAFDLGYWSAYDLRTREVVDVHYHKNIHIPQLRILACLHGHRVFSEQADRWEGYLTNRLARLRCAFTMRRHGIRKRLRHGAQS